MITRFRLEASGVTKISVARQLESAVDGIFTITQTFPTDWERTDDVVAKVDTIYCGRVVMKRKDTNASSPT